VFICKLRKKLANASQGKNYIETVWGRGYVLREPYTAPPRRCPDCLQAQKNPAGAGFFGPFRPPGGKPELKIIDVFICKLRKKLANASQGKNYIETVWGPAPSMSRLSPGTKKPRRSGVLWSVPSPRGDRTAPQEARECQPGQELHRDGLGPRLRAARADRGREP
jgi:hypothetical protein